MFSDERGVRECVVDCACGGVFGLEDEGRGVEFEVVGGVDAEPVLWVVVEGGGHWGAGVDEEVAGGGVGGEVVGADYAGFGVEGWGGLVWFLGGGGGWGVPLMILGSRAMVLALASFVGVRVRCSIVGFNCWFVSLSRGESLASFSSVTMVSMIVLDC